MSSILVNYENLSNVTSELMLVGHSKSIKNVKQSFDDEMIIATCGRDGMIFIWDLRTNNKKFCSKSCESYLIPHIHVRDYLENYFHILFYLSFTACRWI
jgi:WD40 repeat protein